MALLKENPSSQYQKFLDEKGKDFSELHDNSFEKDIVKILNFDEAMENLQAILDGAIKPKSTLLVNCFGQ